MLDTDLAALYGVETGIVNRAVGRNRGRFPSDFMFQLTIAETNALRFQFGISKGGRGGRRYRPHAFTEQGVAMLSSVLRSERAVAVNILIMRTFVQLRRALSETADLGHRVDGLERQIGVHDAVLRDVVKALRALERPAPQKRLEIGFRPKGLK
jgi:hypothetical protein